MDPAKKKSIHDTVIVLIAIAAGATLYHLASKAYYPTPVQTACTTTDKEVLLKLVATAGEACAYSSATVQTPSMDFACFPKHRLPKRKKLALN